MNVIYFRRRKTNKQKKRNKITNNGSYATTDVTRTFKVWKGALDEANSLSSYSYSAQIKYKLNVHRDLYLYAK